VTALADIHDRLESHYSEIGRPSIDPELMIRMLIVGYCYGLRSERRLTQEVELHLAYRWFCRLDLDDKAPHHSTFSENRLHRFRESDVFHPSFATQSRSKADIRSVSQKPRNDPFRRCPAGSGPVSVVAGLGVSNSALDCKSASFTHVSC
jgi:hypothetical protein